MCYQNLRSEQKVSLKFEKILFKILNLQLISLLFFSCYVAFQIGFV